MAFLKENHLKNTHCQFGLDMRENPFIPETWIFYTVGSISFSEVIRYTKIEDSWKSELISP